MSTLAERMPHTIALTNALGTGILITTPQPIPDAIATRIRSFVTEYESTLSRFRNDSTVAAMGVAEHGGHFDFPQWAAALFDCYDLLSAVTEGAIDPCVGEDLTRLGYGADMQFTMQPGAEGQLGSLHGRPTWQHDVARQGNQGTTLVTQRAVHLDFGACGKGYCVDMISSLLRSEFVIDFVIDAGGDLLVQSDSPITIALEDPSNSANAVGVAHVTHGAFCASAPSRRRWRSGGGQVELHHLLNAISGMPAREVRATWVYSAGVTPVKTTNATPATPATLDTPATLATPAALATPATPTAVASSMSDSTDNPSQRVTYPTAIADGLATALFVTDPNRLANALGDIPFQCALLRHTTAGMQAAASTGFPGEFFTS